MYKADIAQVINVIIDDLVRGGHVVDQARKVFLITVRADVAEDKHSQPKLVRYVHLMYHVASNYVLVGSQVSDTRPIHDHRVWKWEAHHDSCWRSDGTEGVIRNQYFQMCKDAFPGVAPIKLFTSAHLERIQVREVSKVAHVEPGSPITLSF